MSPKKKPEPVYQGTEPASTIHDELNPHRWSPVEVRLHESYQNLSARTNLCFAVAVGAYLTAIATALFCLVHH